jgi:hypothetical protein
MRERDRQRVDDVRIGFRGLLRQERRSAVPKSATPISIIFGHGMAIRSLSFRKAEAITVPGHRCAGEWISLATLKIALGSLAKFNLRREGAAPAYSLRRIPSHLTPPLSVTDEQSLPREFVPRRR